MSSISIIQKLLVIQVAALMVAAPAFANDLYAEAEVWDQKGGSENVEWENPVEDEDLSESDEAAMAAEMEDGVRPAGESAPDAKVQEATVSEAAPSEMPPPPKALDAVPKAEVQKAETVEPKKTEVPQEVL